MKLDISRLLRVPDKPLTFELTESWQPVELSGEVMKFEGDVSFIGTASLISDGMVRLRGTFACAVRRECHRCLRETVSSMDVAIDEIFARMESEDEDIYLFSGESVCPDEMLQQNLLLSLPMQALCREDCKGLCPKCGADLNEGACACREEGKVLHPELQKWLQDHKEV